MVSTKILNHVDIDLKISLLHLLNIIIDLYRVYI